jgi:group I intron endonuclease
MKNTKIKKKININIPSIVPIRSYLNSDKQKEEICRDNKNKSGVYRWVNKINGKSYVGSSTSLSRRILFYYYLSSLKREVNGSIIIYRALLKYGYSNFSLDIIEYCEPNKLISREQYYIDLLNPEYNILKKAGADN